MIESIDHLIIAVKNLDEAESNYQKIFGLPPVWKGEHKKLGTRNSIFNFSNTYLELLSVNGNGVGADFVSKVLSDRGEGLCGIALGTNDIEKIRTELRQKSFTDIHLSVSEGEDKKNSKIRRWKNLFLPTELTRGLFAFAIEHFEGELPIADAGASGIGKLDHVVINTSDANKFIETYRDFFKIRLALDTVIEHWGHRMLFFRVNKTTLEVVEKSDRGSNDDRLWGLAWEVENLDAACERLILEGVEVSKIKNGLKKDTRVATIKSHIHNVPTMLIQHS
jgi:catechol 2,3-dioxygenase-like lactoylglutathione lyase family enzyme